MNSSTWIELSLPRKSPLARLRRREFLKLSDNRRNQLFFSLSWETSGSAGGLAKFENFRNAPSRCVDRQLDSPRPDPLPQGEGKAGGSFGCWGGCRADTAAGWLLKRQRKILPLPEGEGRGEGKGDLAVRTLEAPLSKSADRPKGAMALSHSLRSCLRLCRRSLTIPSARRGHTTLPEPSRNT